MAKRERSAAQREAERAYRTRRESVLVRFTPAEAKALDHARGGESRAAFVKRAVKQVVGQFD